MIRGLPPGAVPYRRTATFTEASIPDALLRDHSTKEGVWGLIRVEHGRLLYVVTDPAAPSSDQVLIPDLPPGIIEPGVLHRVEPLGEVRFYVEFLRCEKPKSDGGALI